MPLYDYRCGSCGPFREWRGLARSGDPADCPACGRPAPRAVSAPSLATMDGSRRRAHDRNERSAHEPKVVRRPSPGHDHGGHRGGHGHGHHHHHGAASRPWMIGH